MSAQTTDKKVNQVTPELFEIAPNAKLMSQLDAEKIQSIIRYTKSGDPSRKPDPSTQ